MQIIIALILLLILIILWYFQLKYVRIIGAGDYGIHKHVVILSARGALRPAKFRVRIFTYDKDKDLYFYDSYFFDEFDEAYIYFLDAFKKYLVVKTNNGGIKI